MVVVVVVDLRRQLADSATTDRLIWRRLWASKPPTNPSLHAGFAVVAAAGEPKSAFEHADATLDARTPAVRPPKSSALPDLL
jgi:hypothetical protein